MPIDKTAIHTQQRLAHDDGVHEDAQDVVSGVKVSMTDTLGTIFLGLLALILLVALLRAQKRNRVEEGIAANPDDLRPAELSARA